MLEAIKKIYGIEDQNNKNKKSTTSDAIDKDQNWSSYTKSEKKHAMRRYEALGSFAAVEREIGTSRTTIQRWHEIYHPKNTMQNVNDLYTSNITRVVNTRGANEINARDRQKQLLGFIKGKALITNQLVDLLGVTAATVRTDIKYLLSKGAIKDISENTRARLVIAI